MELKTACSYATVSAAVCSELAAELSGPPQTGESGSLLNRRQHAIGATPNCAALLAECLTMALMAALFDSPLLVLRSLLV